MIYVESGNETSTTIARFYSLPLNISDQFLLFCQTDTHTKLLPAFYAQVRGFNF